MRASRLVLLGSLFAAWPLAGEDIAQPARPLAYRLDLTLDPARERFTGHAEIDTELAAPAREIALNGRGLSIRAATAQAGGRRFAGTWSQLDAFGTARLTFPESLPAGAVTLSFDYDAPFAVLPAGLFRARVGGEWYAWSQFEALDARAAFPAFDRPGFKTPYSVTLRTRPGDAAISNAPEVSNTLEDGLAVHRFAVTAPLPSYHLALMAGPFAVSEGTLAPNAERGDPLPLRLATTGNNAGRLDFAMTGTRQIVTLLEDYTGQPFPFAKLDEITTPLLPGAMENAGAVLYRESLLTLDEQASTDRKRRFAAITAHELAHQWFGASATPANWDEVWLSESFATWLGYRIGGKWRADLGTEAGALRDGFAAMDLDALAAGRAMRQPVQAEPEALGAFDPISYGKGGQVLGMFEHFIGAGNFREAVRRYLAARGGKSARSEDFYAALDAVSGDPRLVPALRGFVERQGVPLLTFAALGEGRYRVHQSRYAALAASVPEMHWDVPLCLHRDGEEQCLLLDAPDAVIAVSGAGPLMPNAGGLGYYRFELPRADWDGLIERADRLPPGEALALADSLYASFAAGRAAPEQVIALAGRLAANPDSYAADAGYALLKSLSGQGLLDGRGKAAYRRLVARAAGPQLAALGFATRVGLGRGEDPQRAQQRLQLIERLAWDARDGAVRGALARAARDWLAGDEGALDPSLYTYAFDVYVAQNGLAGARRLMTRAFAGSDQSQRAAAMIAAGWSGNSGIGRWLLAGRDAGSLDPLEEREILRGLLASGGTRQLGFDWLSRRLDVLAAPEGGIFHAARVPRMLAGFCAPIWVERMAGELRPRLAGKAGAMELERAIEKVRNCSALSAARRAETSRAMIAAAR